VSISVIISTYNQPRWLDLALTGWRQQSHQPSELIIADDGSTEETADVIKKHTAHFPSLKHIWQPDDGFGKTQILNKAITASTQEYLVFSDGDCIPRRDFLSVHAHQAKPGRFLSGGYHKLPRLTSESVDADSISNQRCFDADWLGHHGMPWSLKNAKLRVKGSTASLFDKITTTRATFNGHNASAWRKDVLNAKGFDTRMKYGGEDRELGERLENANVHGYGIRYRAICIHLDHGRGYVNQADIDANNRIREETRSLHLTQTAFGL